MWTGLEATEPTSRGSGAKWRWRRKCAEGLVGGVGKDREEVALTVVVAAVKVSPRCAGGRGGT